MGCLCEEGEMEWGVCMRKEKWSGVFVGGRGYQNVSGVM